MSDDTPVYVISVAAQLSGLHPQTLRAYDRLGLVSPGRAAGRGRRYSLRDILMLREVQRLSQEEGVNLSGIKRILELEDESQRNQVLVAEMSAEIAQLRAELESTRGWRPGWPACCAAGESPRRWCRSALRGAATGTGAGRKTHPARQPCLPRPRPRPLAHRPRPP